MGRLPVPYRIPDPEDLPERVETVLSVVDLLFTTGHTAPSGDQLVLTELVDRATLLARRPPGQFALRAAIAAVHAEAPGLAALDELAGEPALATYPYLGVARADPLRRAGQPGPARAAYEEALLFTENEVEREFLLGRVAQLD